MAADWKHALKLFEDAVDLPAEARQALIGEIARNDAALATQVRSLLAAHTSTAEAALAIQVQAALVAPTASAEEFPGFVADQQVGPYRLLHGIGRGGMASVWLAERVEGTLRRTFALKLPQMVAARRGFAERFDRERDILARLRHPHIARLHDAGVDASGQPFLALDYIEGAPITRWCDARTAVLRERLALFGQVLEAVQFAHANLVIHRDLKPSNILVDANAQVSLLDFGIAKLLDDSGGSIAETELTAAGGRLLTLQYASPEQIRGDALTTATDIYSLGVVLHELLAGTRPYRLAFDSAAQLELAITNAARESLVRNLKVERARAFGLRNVTALRRMLAGDLDAIVGKAMEKSPADRYATVEMLHDDVRRYLDGHPVRARRPSRWRAATRFLRRHAAASIVVGALLGAVLASAIIAVHTAQRERAQRERAEAVRTFLIGVFDQANPDENKGQPFTAQQLLEKGERQLAEQTDAPVATRADLTAVIGNLYWGIGDFTRAEPLLTRALETANDPDVPADIKARALIGLANMQSEKRAFDDALANLDRAYGFARTAGDAGAVIAADARRQRADVLVRRGDFTDAEALLRELLVSDAVRFGARSEAMATNWRLLAISLEELSRYDESEKAFNEALAISRALHGNTHSSVAYILNDLGLMLMHRGDLPGAERALREGLKVTALLFGAQTRASWAVESNLLRVLELEGRFAEALPQRLAMLAKEKQLLAETTPETLAFHTNFTGLDYRELGRFEEAEATFREALAMWARIHGTDDSPDSASARMNLGITLGLRGRLVEAEAAMRRGIAIRVAHEPPGSMTLNLSRGELGQVLRLQGRFADARKEHTEAVAAYSAALASAGETVHPTLATLLAMRAESELDDGAAGAAEATASDALTMARRVLPTGNVRLGSSLYASARANLALERAAMAEPLLREALIVRSPTYPATDPRMLEVKVALIGALEALQRTDEARALRGELVPQLKAMTTSPYANELLRRLESR